MAAKIILYSFARTIFVPFFEKTEKKPPIFINYGEKHTQIIHDRR